VPPGRTACRPSPTTSCGPEPRLRSKALRIAVRAIEIELGRDAVIPYPARNVA
jgi:hypothetical protein